MNNKIIFKTNKIFYDEANLFISEKPKVVHSKNPFLIIQPQWEKEKPIKNYPLNGVEILKICKCELPKEVLKIDISGQNYDSVDKEELKYFNNILEFDASENKLNLNDFDIFGNLKKLNLQSNSLVYLDELKYKFFDLEYLNLSFNNINFQSLSELKKLKNLKELLLVNNNLDELNNDFSEFKSLEILNLSFNKFNGNHKAEEFWKILGKIKKIKKLDLSNNLINGIHTKDLVAGNFKNLEILDLRNNVINDQMNIICCRNFSNLKKIIISGNLFSKNNYNYLENELKIRLGAQVINESNKFTYKKTKENRYKLTYDKLIIVKDKPIKKILNNNNDFFGIEIIDQDNKKENSEDNTFNNFYNLENKNYDEDKESDNNNNFFITEVEKNKNKEFEKKEEFNNHDLISKINFDKEFNFKELNNYQLMGISKIMLGSMIEYDKIKSLNDSYKTLKILTYDKKPYNMAINKYKIK